MYGFWESNTGLLQQVFLTTELLFFHPLDRNFSSIHFWYSPLVSLLFSLNPCSVSRTKLGIHLPPSDHHSMLAVHLHVTWLRGLILQSDSCPHLHLSKPSPSAISTHTAPRTILFPSFTFVWSLFICKSPRFHLYWFFTVYTHLLFRAIICVVDM